MIDLRSEILAIAREHLTGLRGAGGRNISAICPFHQKADGSPEKSPSFSMSTTTGLWQCFSCHSAGNLRTFLRDVGVPHFLIEKQYQEVIEEASHALPPPFDPLRPEIRTDDPIPESLLGLFQFVWPSLEEDGFTEDTLAHFDVGFDKKHMRITYPLRDVAGSLVGISGRTVTGDEPRYKIYTTEYTAWGLPPRDDGDTKKRAVLWNMDRVFPLLVERPEREIVVVEGFKACMWVAQAGIPNVVAMLGSSLTEEQHWILENLNARVYLMTDNDPPGRRARRNIGRWLSQSLDVHIVTYGDEVEGVEVSQPDQLAPEAIQEALHGADDYFVWKCRSAGGYDHVVR